MLGRGSEQGRLDHGNGLHAQDKLPQDDERPLSDTGTMEEEKKPNGRQPQQPKQQQQQHYHYQCHYDHIPATIQSSLRDELEDERKRCPGAWAWAKEEHRLFEILYLRQDLPLLPAHWDVEFRGVLMDASLFLSSPQNPPIIYAHSKKQFSATSGIIRLLDLTATVRGNCQLGIRHKTPWRIKRVLDSLVTWAAEDGGYKDLNYVPNIVVDVVENLDEPCIIGYIERRMRAIVRLQCDFLHARDRADFWDVDVVQTRYFPNVSIRTDALLDRYMDPARADETQPVKHDAATGKRERQRSISPIESAPSFSQSVILSLDAVDRAYDEELQPAPIEGHEVAADGMPDGDETPRASPLLTDADLSARPSPQADRHPAAGAPTADPALAALPVVYGLFILSSSVLLVTADAAKGDAAQVSVHVDLHFADLHQSVWNALTVALAVCLARDDLMARVADFGFVAAPDDSDPDASRPRPGVRALSYS